jgi:hypothetical protein
VRCQQRARKERSPAQLRLPPRLGLARTFPLSRALELKSREVRTGLRHRLGLSMLPPDAPAVQCTCAATLRPCDSDHGMRCLS